jgi:hypothetical protein
MVAIKKVERDSTSTASVLDQLRLPETFTGIGGGIKQPLKPTYGRLNRHRFSRVHPGEDFKYPALIVTDKDSDGQGESYLASHHLASQLGTMASPRNIRLAVDTTGTPRLVGEPILRGVGKPNLWHQSLIDAIKQAERFWVRVEANMDAGQYQVTVSQNDLGEPRWPDRTMHELVLDCFKDRIILKSDHPLIMQLEGRI